jgi:hypothetical protein
MIYRADGRASDAPEASLEGSGVPSAVQPDHEVWEYARANVACRRDGMKLSDLLEAGWVVATEPNEWGSQLVKRRVQ